MRIIANEPRFMQMNRNALKKIPFLSQKTLILLTVIVSVILFFIPLQLPSEKTSNETILKGEVKEVSKSSVTTFENREYLQQELLIEAGKLDIPLSSNLILKDSPQLYQTGDNVLVGKITEQSGENSYFLVGFDRSLTLLFLTGAFLLVVCIIGRKQGVKALVSMMFSFLVISKLILPLILTGFNPLFISIVGVMIIVPFSFALTHGLNKKSLSSMLSTIVTLIVIGVLTMISVYSAHLTGISTEEIETLSFISKGTYDLSSLLIAGIIIGALGILDDVTVTQASVVYELSKSKSKFLPKEIFNRSMIVGRDHIASVINTLILVYTGAFLSTLLLFLTFPRPLIVLLNDETVVIQIVIALVGSIGLILAVPITTYISIQILMPKIRLGH